MLAKLAAPGATSPGHAVIDTAPDAAAIDRDTAARSCATDGPLRRALQACRLETGPATVLRLDRYHHGRPATGAGRKLAGGGTSLPLGRCDPRDQPCLSASGRYPRRLRPHTPTAMSPSLNLPAQRIMRSPTTAAASPAVTPGYHVSPTTSPPGPAPRTHRHLKADLACDPDSRLAGLDHLAPTARTE